MNLTIIAAMTKDRVIGKDNALPWDIAQEMQQFTQVTKENIVIMGRKTFESLKEPLANRYNIVVSKTMQAQEGITVCNTISQALSEAKKIGKKIFVIGGAKIYKAFLPYANCLRISYINFDVKGDTHFPEFSENAWDKEILQQYEKFTLTQYTR